MKKFRKWMDEHEEWVRIAAGFGVVVTAVGLGVGLSRTFRMDAQDKVDALSEKNKELVNEIGGLWAWIDAQTAAGAEFKKIDESFVIDGQNYSC